MIALQDGDFVIVERQAVEADCELATLGEPVTLLLAPSQGDGFGGQALPPT